MTPSSFGWVSNLKISKLPEHLHAPLHYMTALTVLAQESTEEAQYLWDTTIHNSASKAKFTMAEDRLRQLGRKGPGALDVLLVSLLSASVALPMSFVITEFAVTGAGMFRMARGRKAAWKEAFHTPSLRKAGKPVPTALEVGEAPTREWERNVLTKLKKVDKDRASLQGPRGVGDGVLQDAVDLLFEDDSASAKVNNASEKIPPNKYWQSIQLSAERMEDIITDFVNDAQELTDLGLPVLSGRIEYLTRSAEAPFRDIKWLKEELEPIRKGEKEVDYSSRTRLQTMAQDRLTSVWLLQFIALHVPVAGTLDNTYFHKPSKHSIFHNSSRPFRGAMVKPGEYPVPYKVNGEWMRTKIVWKSDASEGDAIGIVRHTRSPKKYERIYEDIAAERVTVEPDLRDTIYGPYANVRIKYVSPKLEDAIVEYAYYLLIQDIIEILVDLSRSKLRMAFYDNRDFLNQILSWTWSSK